MYKNNIDQRCKKIGGAYVPDHKRNSGIIIIK